MKRIRLGIKESGPTREFGGSDDPYTRGVEHLITKQPNMRDEVRRGLRSYAKDAALGSDELEAAERYLKPLFSDEYYYRKLLQDLREVGALVESKQLKEQTFTNFEAWQSAAEEAGYEIAKSRDGWSAVAYNDHGKEVGKFEVEWGSQSSGAGNLEESKKGKGTLVIEATPDDIEGFDPDNQPSYKNQDDINEPEVDMSLDADAISIDRLEGEELRDKFGDGDVFEITDPSSEVGVYFIAVNNSEENPEVTITTLDGDGDLSSDHTDDLVDRVQDQVTECRTRRLQRVLEARRRKLKEEGGDPESIIDEQPVEVELVIDEEPEAVTISGDVCDILSALVGDQNAELVIASISGEEPEVDEFTTDHAAVGPDDLPDHADEELSDEKVVESVKKSLDTLSRAIKREGNEATGYFIVNDRNQVIDGPYDDPDYPQECIEDANGHDSNGHEVTVEFGTVVNGKFHKAQ